MTQGEELFYFSGIDAESGGYAIPPLALGELAAIARGSRVEGVQRPRGVVPWVNPADPGQAGWGLIEPEDLDPAVREALAELVRHRERRAGSAKVRRFTYERGESKEQFLLRHGAGSGPVDPRKVPYYLLIVGGPEAIPFDFQYGLDVQYAVGRLDLATPEDYARYARRVVEAETSQPPPLPRRLALFGVQNGDDPMTRLSADQLVRPLALALSGAGGEWQVETDLGAAASKARLRSRLGGEATPALLFTAGHALLYQRGDARQLPGQGALVCADWPGPGAGPLDSAAHCFAAEDLSESADLRGLVAFFFACFSAGTPRRDAFARDGAAGASDLAPCDFVSALPRRLLARGALAVIGHVDRAFPHSFHWAEAGSQCQVFEATLHQLMAGLPVGAAMEYFGQRHAELGVDLLARRAELAATGGPDDDREEVRLWTGYNDARGYVVLGDPAVRIAG